MKRIIDPGGIAPPASAYKHGVLTEPVTALLTLSGQLGEAPDGTCPPDATAQARLAWANVLRLLDEAGMGVADIVKVTSYLVGEETIAPYVAVHKDVTGAHEPPWTLVVVAALGDPGYLVEVDVTAAR